MAVQAVSASAKTQAHAQSRCVHVHLHQVFVLQLLKPVLDQANNSVEDLFADGPEPLVFASDDKGGHAKLFALG